MAYLLFIFIGTLILMVPHWGNIEVVNKIGIMSRLSYAFERMQKYLQERTINLYKRMITLSTEEERSKMTLAVKQRRLDIPPTRKEGELNIVSFLKELMRRRKRLPTQLARDLGVSHPTVARWLAGEDIPSSPSCRKLADYSGVPLEKVLSIAGHLPLVTQAAPSEWPEFREYAQRKYPAELDEDTVTLIEDLIDRRRARRRGGQEY